MPIPEGLYSDGSSVHCRRVRGGPETHVRVSFRSLHDDGVTEAWVRTAPDGEAEYHACRLIEDGPFHRWEAQVPVKSDRVGYRFVMMSQGRVVYLNQRGSCLDEPFDAEDFVWLDQFLPVSWLTGTTFYQIFPDRFARGHHAPIFEGMKPWGTRPLRFEDGGCRDFCGGDLTGIVERIPYLCDLGVGAVYLTPIFPSNSNHRYDVNDYCAIDPKLGTDADFVQLVRALHDKGIRIILDAVFNHVGSAHRWFNREGLYSEDGAWQSLAAPAADFFMFYDHPQHYECWMGVDTLPKLDYRSRGLREAIYAGGDAIAKYWLRPPFSVDGWRFDVANMLGRCGKTQLHHEVWSEMRRHLKGVRPDAYLVGEHFFDGTPLLTGDGLDAVMNYHGFYFPLLRWLTGKEHRRIRGGPMRPRCDGSGTTLAASLVSALSRLPFQVASAQFNLLGSHDTPRIKTLLNDDTDLVSLAMTILMTWPGVPSVFYGDEIGLTGEGDPDCRKCMPWDDSEWDVSLRGLVRQLATLRKSRIAIAEGGVRMICVEDGLISYARVFGKDAMIVVASTEDRPRRRQLNLGFLGWHAGELGSPLTGRVVRLKDGCASMTFVPKRADVFELVG